jgi:hypothetical protein
MLLAGVFAAIVRLSSKAAGEQARACPTTAGPFVTADGPDVGRASVLLRTIEQENRTI